MQAVREVDLQVVTLAEVHLRRTEPRAGRAEFLFARGARGGILDLQMARLVLFVDRAGHEDIRQPVRLQGRGLHVILRLAREPFAHERLQRGSVALVAARHAEPRELPKRHPCEPGRHHAPRHAVGERRAHVPHALHLLPAVRRLQPLEVILADCVCIRIGQDCLCGGASALHRDVHALDAQGVEKPRAVADDQHARHIRFRHGVEATLGNHLRAVRDGLAALDVAFDARCGLEPSEQAERIDLRARVVERVGVAHHHLRFAHVIDEPAAVGVEVARPAKRVHHLAGGLRAGRHLDQFLDAEGVCLRTRSLKPLLGDEALREDAATAFGEHDHLRANLLGRQVVGFLPPVLVESLLARTRAHHAAVLFHELRHGKARVDFRAELRRDLRQVGGHLRERHDRKLLRTHHRRHPRNLHAPLRREERAEALLHHFRLARQLLDFLRREKVLESAWVDDSTGKYMRTHAAALVQHHDARFLLAGVAQQRNGRREARRPRTHDQDVRFNHFSSSLMRAGMISSASPTMPRSATPKIGAWGSVFTAMIVSAPRMPSRCWIAPEMPKQR